MVLTSDGLQAGGLVATLRALVRIPALVLLLSLAACAAGPRHAPRQADRGLPGAVATVNPLATEAGLAVLRAGGNAIDAAVTAALTLGVVDSHNSGIGGGCFLLVRTARGELLAIDGREMAPAAATRDMYVRDGEVDPTLSVKGALAVGIPGSLAAYDFVLRRSGRRTLAQALAPGRRLARAGAPLSASVASRLKSKRDDLASFEATRRVFLDPSGAPWRVGHPLVQRDLAATYESIAREGIGWFYGGPFARRLEAWMRAHGGIVTTQDFADYRIRLRRPVRSTYRGYEVVGFPPPSSGGVHVAQILTMLERYPLGAWPEARWPGRRLHVMAEAMKLAFADRARWLGDPDYSDVPRSLCEGGYCRDLAARIDETSAQPVEGAGTPPGAESNFFGKHTTHVAAADAAGNWVALTTTINTSFGSKVVVPGTGVLLNNQMDDFAAQPGVPNAYGLVGAEANSIAPGKRPLSSMSPTILLRDGVPVLTVGGAGGPTIITQVVQTIVNHVDLELDIEAALAAPRIHHQWRPDALRVEAALDETTAQALHDLGHDVDRRGTVGVAQAILRRPDGTFVAVSDPRIDGGASGRAGTTRR